eukprot:48912_1
MKSSAANTTAINNLARAEYKKLMAKRQAKLHDEAWLPVGAIPPNDNIKSPDFLGQDVEIVHRSLVNNGISMKDITTDGFAILLEESRKYVLKLMTDATDYAVHSHGSEHITPVDLELAKERQNSGKAERRNGGKTSISWAKIWMRWLKLRSKRIKNIATHS